MTTAEKFKQLLNDMLGQRAEVSSSSNPFQCMDWAYLWTFVLGIPKSAIKHLHAYEAYTAPNATTLKYFDLIKNTVTYVPLAGDIVVFNKGTGIGPDGHICVATGEGDVNKFKSADQNWGGKIGIQIELPAASLAQITEATFANLVKG